MKRITAIVLTLALVFTLVACGTSNSTPSASPGSSGPASASSAATATNAASPSAFEDIKKGGDLTIGSSADCSFIASWMLRGYVDRAELTLVYEPLVKLDEQGNYYGYLAKSIVPDPEKLTWTITLRDDVYFSDGSQLNGDVLLWNFENFLANSNTSSTHFGFVDSFEKTGDFTVVIHLKQWTSQIPYSLQDNCGFMYSKKAFDEHGIDWCLQHPVGTGPYVEDKVVTGEYRSYVKNGNYWNKEEEPTFDKVTWKIIADESTAQAALLSNEIDGYFSPSFSMANTILSQKGFQLAQNSTTFMIQFMLFPSEVEGPFADIKVRQAVCYAIDSKSIIDSVTYGYGIYSNQYAGPGTPYYNDSLTGYDYNLDKAKELIASSDYSSGFKTKLYMSNQNLPLYTAIGTIIQNQLKEIGIDLEVVLLDPSVWLETFKKAQDGFIIGGHGFGSNLANQMRSNFSKAAKDGVGMMSYTMLHPDDLDSVINAAVSATDTDTMIDNIQQANKLISDTYCLAFPVFLQPAYYILLTDKLKDAGCFNNTSLSFDYNKLYFTAGK
jgi:peptide/nickel transport system substrate-binding protein